VIEYSIGLPGTSAVSGPLWNGTDLDRDVHSGPLELPTDRPLAPEVMQSIEDEGVRLHGVRTALDDSALSGTTFRDYLSAIEQHYRELGASANGYLSGRNFSQSELLQLQVRLQTVSQQVELLGKGIELAVSGIKTVVQSNV